MKKINLRFINKQNYSTFGVIVTCSLVVTSLIALILNLFTLDQVDGYDIRYLASSIISIIFYLLVCNDFRMGKSNFYYAYYAMLLLLVSDFLLPIIQSFLTNPQTILIILNSPKLILAILMFIFLAIENKKREKKYLNVLLILGGILSLFSIATGIYDLYMLISSLMSLDVVTTYDIIFYINSIVSFIVTLTCIPLIIGFYPFILKKERYY